jgi:hypothetical protein
LRPDVALPPDGHATELVAPVEAKAAGAAADTLEEISAWTKSTLGIDHIPSLWRVLARQPRFLAASPPLANAARSEPSTVPMGSQPVISLMAADAKRSATSPQGQCDAMSERFTADLLVAMTIGELDYLASTLCPISS